MSISIRSSKRRMDPFKVKTTLVVCPVSLMEQWAQEIRYKTENLTVHIHHGSRKFTSPFEVGKFDGNDPTNWINPSGQLTCYAFFLSLSLLSFSGHHFVSYYHCRISRRFLGWLDCLQPSHLPSGDPGRSPFNQEQTHTICKSMVSQSHLLSQRKLT
jgi:hypothetical protein